MSRKQITITIDRPGRDQGKVFQITEMPAAQAERWSVRALLALGRSGVEIPDTIVSAGMAGIATIGIRALFGLRFEEAGPLLDELMTCIAAIPDPARPGIVRPLVADDTEEVATLLQLKSEVFELHTGFSPAAILSIWAFPGLVAASGSPNTETSPA